MNKFKEPLYISMIIFITTVVFSAVEHTFYVEYQSIGLAELDTFVAYIILFEMVEQLVIGLLYKLEEVKKERENLKIRKDSNF